MNVRIPPIYSENYDFHWGIIDVTNKRILDIGGSTGDTCDYFLSKGARDCINVDCNPDYIDQCVQNIKIYNLPIIPVLMNISNASQIESLIEEYKPDVVKMDCEGCEVHLVQVREEILRIVPEYIIETHSDPIFDSIQNKLLQNGYEIVNVKEWAPHIRIVYARRR